MPTNLGSVRRRVLTPQLREVTFAKRGFPAAPSAATQRLEAIPQAVICGFEWGIDARDQWEVERRLDLVDAEQRGFAYEGVTMAFTILDAMGRGHRTRDLLRGPGSRHIFLAYIGMGFAMARLPRPLWKKVVPDLSPDPYYPTMSWLAVDGYRLRPCLLRHPALGGRAEGARSLTAGRARRTIFSARSTRASGARCGSSAVVSAPDVAAAAGRFASHRQPDLWSGIGLAATFAGGCDAEGLAALRRAAGDDWSQLALGVVFAAKARAYSGIGAGPHAGRLLGTDGYLRGQGRRRSPTVPPRPAPDPGSEPAYELWRQRIRAHFEA